MKISKIEVIHELVSLTNQNSNAKQINAAGAKLGKTVVRRVVIGFRVAPDWLKSSREWFEPVL